MLNVFLLAFRAPAVQQWVLWNGDGLETSDWRIFTVKKYCASVSIDSMPTIQLLLWIQRVFWVCRFHRIIDNKNRNKFQTITFLPNCPRIKGPSSDHRFALVTSILCCWAEIYCRTSKTKTFWNYLWFRSGIILLKWRHHYQQRWCMTPASTTVTFRHQRTLHQLTFFTFTRYVSNLLCCKIFVFKHVRNCCQ